MFQRRFVPILIGVLGLILLGISIQTGWAGGAIEMNRVYPHQFPVRLSAIVFGEGVRIDPNEPLGFGDWAVRFGSEPPGAYYRCESPCIGDDPPPMIRIQGLVCDSPLVEGANCDLTIALYKNAPYDCSLAIDETSSGRILVDCPVTLEPR